MTRYIVAFLLIPFATAIAQTGPAPEGVLMCIGVADAIVENSEGEARAGAEARRDALLENHAPIARGEGLEEGLVETYRENGRSMGAIFAPDALATVFAECEARLSAE